MRPSPRFEGSLLGSTRQLLGPASVQRYTLDTTNSRMSTLTNENIILLGRIATKTMDTNNALILIHHLRPLPSIALQPV